MGNYLMIQNHEKVKFSERDISSMTAKSLKMFQFESFFINYILHRLLKDVTWSSVSNQIFSKYIYLRIKLFLSLFHLTENWNNRLINWKNWGKGYLGDLLCRCAKLAEEDKMKFFSIQFYGK